jgi:hypothetical protein
LQEDAQHELNLTDNETTSDLGDVSQAAAGNSHDVRVEPTSAPKRSASTGRGNDPFFLSFPFFLFIPFDFCFERGIFTKFVSSAVSSICICFLMNIRRLKNHFPPRDLGFSFSGGKKADKRG